MFTNDSNRVSNDAVEYNRWLEDLNECQKEAVTAPHQHLLVLAGAGSGKTRVLIHRLAWLLAKRQVEPYQLMAVTFTNKAAKEMQLRLQGLSSWCSQSMWMGTFHAICHRFLRIHHAEANISKTFQVIDTNEQLSIVRQIIEAQALDLETFVPRDLMGYVNAHKEKGIRADEGTFYDRDASIKNDIYRAYDKHCVKENLVDFAELLLRTHELLKRNELLRQHYQARFQHILVDEFQDTNTLQYALLKQWCGQDSCLFAVGDDDQSIYGFRGAKIENLRHFEQHYAKGNVIRLEQSYRSTGAILETANHLIAKNISRLGKTLWTAQAQGEPILLYAAHDDKNEAEWVMQEIRRLHQTGTAWSEIAILYRINAHSRAFEQAAITAGTPYRIYGGFRFYDRAEIRHALAYLRLIINPDDNTSFLRIVNFPTRGIGDRAIEGLQHLSDKHQTSLMRAIPHAEGRAAPALNRFSAMIYQLREQIQAYTLPDLMRVVITESGLSKYYEGQRDGKERLENLDELENAGGQYLTELQRRQTTQEDLPESGDLSEDLLSDKVTEATTGHSILTHFLSDAVLDSAEPESSTKSAISMMSVHSAKGLEFDAVFIAGLEHGTFPHENNENLEEERRLMYVAVTRARKKLCLSYTHQRLLHGRVRQNVPSLFLHEIPSHLLKRIQPIIPSAAPYGKRSHSHFGNAAHRESRGRYTKTSYTGDSGQLPSSKYKAHFDKNLPAKHPFGLGQHVYHEKFGDGIVQAYEGRGGDARIQVNFGGLGQKWLILSLAKLKAR